MATLNIHLETFDDKSFNKLAELSELGPIAVSIAPYQLPLIKPQQISRLKKILSRDGYVLGQQGLNHKCTKCYSFHVLTKGGKVKEPGIDPWHENYCLWFGPIPEKEQEKFMQEGRKQLEAKLGITPLLYTPPNHYFDDTTIKLAAGIGYRWISDRAKCPLTPYEAHGIILVPESEPEIGGNNQIYIHADRWRGDLEKALHSGLVSLNSLTPKKRDNKKIEENRKLKITLKIARDIVAGFGMPKENAEKAAQLLFETKFAGDSFL